MKALSVVSPLNWGIEGFYKLILRGEGLVSVLPQCFLLLAFAAVCFAVSVLAKRRKGL